MRILITGAGGLLGLNLAMTLKDQVEVIATDRKPLRRLELFEFYQTELVTPGAVSTLLDQAAPDAVIHCAALADVDACEHAPQVAQEVNADLPGLIARETARRDIGLVHISTDAVFDGARGGYSEKDAPNPLSVYARTKLEGEQQVMAAHTKAVVTRVNLFGWSSAQNRSLAEFFYYNLKAGKPLKGFVDVHFCPLLVNHLAPVFLNIFEKQLAGLYHLVSPVSLTKYDFGVEIAERFGFDPGLITPISVADSGLKAKRSPNLTMNTDKLAAALGQPLPDVYSGLEELVRLQQAGYPQELAACFDRAEDPAAT